MSNSMKNLKEAFAGESQANRSYLAFAEKEDEQEAKISFDAANQAEKFHEAMFKEALDNKDDVPDKAYFVCQVCGMSYENEPPEKCVVCRAPRSKITEVK